MGRIIYAAARIGQEGDGYAIPARRGAGMSGGGSGISRQGRGGGANTPPARAIQNTRSEEVGRNGVQGSPEESQPRGHHRAGGAAFRRVSGGEVGGEAGKQT